MNKYRNRRVVVNGLTFDSQKEADRWGVLVLKERLGEICNLRRQVRYPLVVSDQLIATYVADFVYEERRQDPHLGDYWDATDPVVEDVKSEATRKLPAYRIKRKLMKALYDTEIRET